MKITSNSQSDYSMYSMCINICNFLISEMVRRGCVLFVLLNKGWFFIYSYYVHVYAATIQNWICLSLWQYIYTCKNNIHVPNLNISDITEFHLIFYHVYYWENLSIEWSWWYLHTCSCCLDICTCDITEIKNILTFREFLINYIMYMEYLVWIFVKWQNSRIFYCILTSWNFEIKILLKVRHMHMLFCSVDKFRMCYILKLLLMLFKNRNF